MTELLPCPFCGSEGHAWIPDYGNMEVRVRCWNQQCHMWSVNDHWGLSKEQWNRRHTPEGWQTVPGEPTREMLEITGDNSAEAYAGMLGAWTAMLAAAPKPGGE